MPRIVRSLMVLTVVALSIGCAGDDDAADEAGGDRPGATSEADQTSVVLPSAGGAAAAQGSGLDDPPGVVDRMLLEGFGEVAIAITGPDGEVQGWCVLLAEEPEQRQRGLMEVEDLQGYAGMLFVWEGDTDSSFYMRNTPMPLSIAWFDADGDLVSTADMEPCDDRDDCPLYPANGSYRFALEVPQGQLDDLGVEEGSRLRVGGACADRQGQT